MCASYSLQDGDSVILLVGSTVMQTDQTEAAACLVVSSPWDAPVESAVWRCITAGTENKI